jgi:putative methionine-R-sulfoxide reductase with GAF domain
MYDPVVVDTFVSIHQELSTTVGEQPAIRNALSAITQNLSALPSSRSLVRFDEINASSEETTAMFELARELAGSQTFSSAAETINRYLRRIVPASTFVLYTFDEQADELEVAFASGQHAAHFSGLRIGRGQRLSGWVAANSTSALNSDPVLDLGDSARSLKPPLRSYLGTAISAAGRLIGVLSVYSPQTEAFTDDHQRVLESIGRQTAKVLDQATKSENAILKRGDSSVTVQGAERLEDFISRHRGLSVPILLIEIDTPSRDTFMVERAISAVLTELNRDVLHSNTVFRYSESSVIVPLTTLDRKGASELVADVAKRLSHTVPTLSTVNGISVGMAVFPHDGNNGTSIVDVARRRSTRVGDSPTAIH